MSAVQDQIEGQRALLEAETLFVTKTRAAVLGIQGTQLRALAMFAEIFERHPYPVIINAAILKLADWFRTSNNTVKFYIFKVFKRASDQDLAKVINTEETVRRILPVLNSNDPVARSLSLRILGCISMIITDNIDAQCAVLKCFNEATERIEVEATIWVADRISARSMRFLPTIFPKIQSKLLDKNTSFDTKLRLVRIFRHMHKDIVMTRKAKAVCLSLLKDHSAEAQLVAVALQTLTQLVKEAAIERKEQIERLYHYALTDVRPVVISNTLTDLVLLGRNDIMFNETHIKSTLKLVNRLVEIPALLQRGFKCIQVLLAGHTQLLQEMLSDAENCNLFVDALTTVEKTMSKAYECKRYKLGVASSQLLTTMVSISLKKNDLGMEIDNRALDKVLPTITATALQAAKCLQKLNISEVKTPHEKLIRNLQRCKAKLYLLLQDHQWDLEGEFRSSFRTIPNLAEKDTDTMLAYLLSIAPSCKTLDQWLPDEALSMLQSSLQHSCIFVNVTKLLLRVSSKTFAEDNTWSGRLLELIGDFGRLQGEDEGATHANCKNGWQLYTIAREAGLAGCYNVMSYILDMLKNQVKSEASRYWLVFLNLMSDAEVILVQSKGAEQLEDLDSRLKDAVNCYIHAFKIFKAFQSLVGTRISRAWFIQLRMDMVTGIQRLLKVLDPSLEQQLGKKKVEKMLQQCAEVFKTLAFRYDFVAQGFLDGDKSTRTILETYAIYALVFEYAIQTLVNPSDSSLSIDPTLVPLLTDDSLPPSRLVCSEFMNKVIDQRVRSDDLIQFSRIILSTPLSLSRQFFSGQKTTSIQFSVEPTLSEVKPFVLQRDQDLILKFEGLIQSPQGTTRRAAIKKAAIVCFVTRENINHYGDSINTNMLFADPAQFSHYGMTFIKPPLVFTTDVVNSYFECKGLLSLPRRSNTDNERSSRVSSSAGYPGSTQQEGWINVFLKLVDENSETWAVGPRRSGRVAW